MRWHFNSKKLKHDASNIIFDSYAFADDDVQMKKKKKNKKFMDMVWTTTL